MTRVSGLLLGGLLGLLLGGAATQLVYLLCVTGGPDAESCGMGVYFLVGPALLLTGGVAGAGTGLFVAGADAVGRLTRTLTFAAIGAITGLAVSSVFAAGRAGEVRPILDSIPAIVLVAGALLGWTTHGPLKPTPTDDSAEVPLPVDSERT